MTTTNTRAAHCELHGEFAAMQLYATVYSTCPDCAEEKRKAEEDCRREGAAILEREQYDERVRRAQIPERFLGRTLADFIAEIPAQQHALNFAKQYAENFDEVLQTGRSALFVGKPGTGKTHLACAIAQHIMQTRRSALFLTVMRAVRRVKDTWSRESVETETQAIDSLVWPHLLILDEVGIQFGSDTEKLVLFDVLNARYERRRPTLLLSNLDANDIKPYLGERIFDRLREDKGEAVAFDWPSYRGRSVVATRTAGASLPKHLAAHLATLPTSEGGNHV